MYYGRKNLEENYTLIHGCGMENCHKFFIELLFQIFKSSADDKSINPY